MLTEAAIIAIAKAVEAGFTYGTVYLKGLTPAQLEERMQWEIDDVKRLREFADKIRALLPGSST